MNTAHAEALADICSELSGCAYDELLPYHPFGRSKAEQIGIKLTDGFHPPTDREIYTFAGVMRERGVRVKYRGSIISG